MRAATQNYNQKKLEKNASQQVFVCLYLRDVPGVCLNHSWPPYKLQYIWAEARSGRAIIRAMLEFDMHRVKRVGCAPRVKSSAIFRVAKQRARRSAAFFIMHIQNNKIVIRRGIAGSSNHFLRLATSATPFYVVQIAKFIVYFLINFIRVFDAYIC